MHFKGDFQSVLCSLLTLIFMSHSMEFESMLFVTSHIPAYLIFEGFQIIFSNSFIDFYSWKIEIKWYEKEQTI